MKDKNIATRVEYELWQQLERLRIQKQNLNREKITLSDLVREALANYVGDTWITKQKNGPK